MITEVFDIGFACDGALYTYVDNVLVSPKSTLFCIFFCSFWVPGYEFKVHASSVSTK